MSVRDEGRRAAARPGRGRAVRHLAPRMGAAQRSDARLPPLQLHERSRLRAVGQRSGVYRVGRYYDPSTGQFLTVDPLVGLTGAAYGYATGDPVDLSDPAGLDVLLGDDPADVTFEWPVGVVHETQAQAVNAFDIYKNGLPTRSAVGPADARAYQIQVAGPTEYRVSGNGESVWADGLNPETGQVIEAKFVGSARSPFVPGSSLPSAIRLKILAQQQLEF